MKKLLIAKLVGVVLAVLAVCATPAAAAVIEFTLGSEPEVELQFLFCCSTSSFTVTALLGSSSAKWVQDAANGTVFSEAVVTIETTPPTVSTFTFTDVIAASAMVNSGSQTITATFDFATVSGQVSQVPEPSTWAMMLIGFAGLSFAFRQSRRRVSFA
jgi:hypothetical protein